MLTRPVVPPAVGEADHTAEDESDEATTGVSTKPRSALHCLLLTGFCLAMLTSISPCSDQPDASPASTSMAQNRAVPRLTKRPATVADSIQMTRLGDPSYTAGNRSNGLVARFSPDKARFVVVLRKGNLEANTNEYSLVLFQTSQLSHSPRPQVLVSLASSSNRPAIQNVVWLDDNDTILFLGERPGEQTALYSLKCSSNELKKLTNHATSLTSFVTTPSGDKVVFSAVTVSTLPTDSIARNGIAVTSEDPSELVRESLGESTSYEDTLWIQQLGKGTETQLPTLGTTGRGTPTMSFSPDGAYLLLQTLAPHIATTWRQYDDKFLQAAMDSSTGTQGLGSYVAQYELVDMGTGANQVLADSPIGADYGSDMIWAADSKSVVVSNMHLPLDVADTAERALRKAHTFLVEFKIPTRQFLKISDEDLKLVSWDPQTGYVACDIGQFDSGEGKPTPKAYFHKTGETWSRSVAPEPAAVALQPDIVLVEDMNTPPHIVAVDPTTGHQSRLMDLNPQFRDIALARVEEITWKAGYGRELKGGLYWPPDYIPGKKYPLILQTHAWLDNKFWMDGPWTTAFSAQALAGKGFFVLQVGELSKSDLLDWHIVETFYEAKRAMAAYESAIGDLDRKGLIDRNRVGIIGFSRSLWYVMYTLAHPKHPFAAAVVADGVDFSYFQYMLSSANPAKAAEFERVHGGPPFGKRLSQWLKQSPEFLMDKVETPLLIQTLNLASLMSDWHWHTGLSRLGKPVEMIYIPDGTHILEKPWERMTSQQVDVDWFCFWLKGEEDPDPAKAQQYKRWRELRRLKH